MSASASHTASVPAPTVHRTAPLPVVQRQHQRQSYSTVQASAVQRYPYNHIVPVLAVQRQLRLQRHFQRHQCRHGHTVSATTCNHCSFAAARDPQRTLLATAHHSSRPLIFSPASSTPAASLHTCTTSKSVGRTSPCPSTADLSAHLLCDQGKMSEQRP